MPKNKRKNNIDKKQIKQLATRLMQISLLVDDYLYKQKPILQSSAEAYIREISSYKDQCHQDARSLQVIEKLTRVMKGIIKEQQKLQMITEDVYPSQDLLVPIGMISPVYSLVDEDMTQYLEKDNTPTVELDNRSEIISKDLHDQTVVLREPMDIGNEEPKVIGNEIEQNQKSYNVLQNVVPNKNEESEVIDLCDDDTDKIAHQDFGLDLECEFNQDIQRAISNLSIRDIEAYTTPPFSQECSQSILDDHPTYSTCYTRPIDVLFPHQQDFDSVIKSATTTQQNPATETVIQEKIKNIALPIANSQLYANKALYHARNETSIQKASTDVAFNDRTTKIKLPTTKQNIQIPVKNAAKHIQNAKKSNPRTKKLTTNNSTKTDTCKKKVNGSVKISKNARIKPFGKTKVKASEAKTSQQSNTQPTQGDSINNLTYHNSKVQGQQINDTNNDKSKVTIYNTSVVADLSWIENIRFVREILSDEYEALTVTDTFWDDCTLPCNWNEDDFNY